ncbi:MAG: MerR family DNA-binding protein [Steroidobacteraceae bacterium]
MPKTAAQDTPTALQSRPIAASMTIGRLARAAEVGVETVRYYQRRQLLAVPPGAGGVRRYPTTMIDRIRFIKRAQNLGFSLDEIRELLRLEKGGSRDAVRKIAGARLDNIREKIAALEQMERVLAELLIACERGATATACPIITALNKDRRCR